ncbi:ATP-binding protein [Capnocytophaga canimorsus]|nr:ATP-binding protein [Capnocytophaga canimorsus]WGU68563.1 ATP-binding protein [Capnocytophaga canimorsus]
MNQETENKPSEFEVIFISENVQYRYGFEVTKEKVISEWLYRKEKVKEVEVFYREENKAKLHSTLFSNGEFIWNKSMVRDNALLLSVATQFNDDIANKVVQYFSNEIKIISGIQEEGFEGFTIQKIDSDKGKHEILKMLKAADIGIEDLKVETIDKENLPKDMPDELKRLFLKENIKIYSDSSVFTFHKKFDTQQKQIGNALFSLEEESTGTKKYLALSGPILDVLKNGYTLIVDELDSKLHPNLVEEIVQLFNSKEVNIKNAQLIFNTHNTNLLTPRLFRRDQIWFTEKNEYGEASLYSLADFKTNKVRKMDAFENNYIRGKYGAVPFLNLFENFKDYLKSDEKEK